jgi:polyferredoxin/tetratricopeptide (TPR) repeat protein
VSKRKPRLPVLPPDPPRRPSAPARTVRPSRRSKWRAVSLISVQLVIAAHIAHWLLSGRTVTPVEPSEAMAFAKGGMINAGLLFFAAAILLTAIFGRFFCGWGCHLVALQDLSRWLLEKIGIRPKPLRSRLLGWVPALAFTYMFLWPVAWRLWHGDDPTRIHGTELTTAQFWATFPGWIIGGLTFLVCGFLCVYFLGAKGFCTYACPYGAIFGAADRLAPLRVRVTDACSGCGHCTAVCTSNVRVHEEVRDFGMVVDSGCMKCTDCISVCPNDALYLGFGRLPIAAPRRTEPRPARRPDHGWTEELVLAAAFAAGFLAFRGLYGRVPFLMSLGSAGVFAFLALLGWRLARRPDLAWRRWRLRSDGRLTAAGAGAVAALAAVGLLWLYCGAVRLEGALAMDAFRATSPLRSAALDVATPVAPLDAAQRATVETARKRLDRVRRLGFVSWVGDAGRRAQLAFLAGDLDGFSADARVALAAGESVWEVSVLEARLQASRGDLAGALVSGERAISHAPGDPSSYATVGVLMAGAGGLDAGAEILDRGLKRFPDSVDLLYDSGVVAAYRGRIDEAIRDFSRAVEIQPTHLNARENLAGMLAGAGRFDEAVEQYHLALALSPRDAALRALAARALAGAGRLDAARAEARRALELEPGNPDATELLRRLGPPAPPGAPGPPATP